LSKLHATRLRRVRSERDLDAGWFQFPPFGSQILTHQVKGQHLPRAGH
jgi:hypothetical protein